MRSPRGPCLCGDTECPSCGTAQGTHSGGAGDWEPDPADLVAGDEEFARRTIHVWTSCDGERIDESTITVDNVSEDFEGADLVQFVCPKCGARHESRRFG